jgi:hypothetical protein
MRYQFSFYFVLTLLNPMLIAYHDLSADVAVLAYFVMPISYMLLFPLVHWFRDERKWTQ